VFKAKIGSKMNIGNSARKLDFPLGNGDGLQESWKWRWASRKCRMCWTLAKYLLQTGAHD